MKKLLGIICLALVITGAFSFGDMARATLLRSGDVITDSETGLEWLAMSQTVNKSPENIIAGGYGLAAEGWGLATIPQITTLFQDAGMTGPFDGGLRCLFTKSIILLKSRKYVSFWVATCRM